MFPTAAMITMTTCCAVLVLQAEAERMQSIEGQQQSLLKVMLNINSVLTDAAAAMVDDSFLRCFTSATPDPWNWNFYLAPLWYVRLRQMDVRHQHESPTWATADQPVTSHAHLPPAVAAAVAAPAVVAVAVAAAAALAFASTPGCFVLVQPSQRNSHQPQISYQPSIACVQLLPRLHGPTSLCLFLQAVGCGVSPLCALPAAPDPPAEFTPHFLHHILHSQGSLAIRANKTSCRTALDPVPVWHVRGIMDWCHQVPWAAANAGGRACLGCQPHVHD